MSRWVVTEWGTRDWCYEQVVRKAAEIPEVLGGCRQQQDASGSWGELWRRNGGELSEKLDFLSDSILLGHSPILSQQEVRSYRVGLQKHHFCWWVHSDDGMWLRLTNGTINRCVPVNDFTAAWCFWLSTWARPLSTSIQKKDKYVPTKGNTFVNPCVLLYMWSISGGMYKKMAALDACA